MLETECYKELNLFNPDGGPTPDLLEDQPPPPPRRGFFDRMFRRRRVSNNQYLWHDTFLKNTKYVSNQQGSHEL